MSSSDAQTHRCSYYRWGGGGAVFHSPVSISTLHSPLDHLTRKCWIDCGAQLPPACPSTSQRPGGRAGLNLWVQVSNLLGTSPSQVSSLNSKSGHG